MSNRGVRRDRTPVNYGVEWMEPPAAYHQTSARLQVIGELKGRPGEWARVASGHKNTIDYGFWRRHGCDITLRKNNEGTFDTFARYVGPKTNGRRRPGRD